MRRRRRRARRQRLDPAAQIAQHARQVAVAAEREHVGDLVADRRTARGDHRQPAREADAHQAHGAVGRQGVIRREPRRGVFDLVHRLGREAVADEIRQRDRHDGDAAGREVAGEPLQPRLLDAHGVDAGRQDGACGGSCPRGDTAARGWGRDASGSSSRVPRARRARPRPPRVRSTRPGAPRVRRARARGAYDGPQTRPMVRSVKSTAMSVGRLRLRGMRDR